MRRRLPGWRLRNESCASWRGVYSEAGPLYTSVTAGHCLSGLAGPAFHTTVSLQQSTATLQSSFVKSSEHRRDCQIKLDALQCNIEDLQCNIEALQCTITWRESFYKLELEHSSNCSAGRNRKSEQRRQTRTVGTTNCNTVLKAHSVELLCSTLQMPGCSGWGNRTNTSYYSSTRIDIGSVVSWHITTIIK